MQRKVMILITLVGLVFGPNSFANAATAPSSPEPITITSYDSTSVSFSWTRPSSDGGSPLADYVFRYRVAGSGSEWNLFNDGVSTETTATITGLTRGVNYEFGVGAVNSVGTGWSSTTNQITSTNAVLPDSVKWLDVSSFNGESATLSWWRFQSNDSGAPILDYIVQYRVVGANSWITFQDAVSTEPTATVTGLVRGLSYEFRVGAVNTIGTGWGFDNIVVASGGSHSCAVLLDHSVECWGSNQNGQLSNGIFPLQTRVHVSGISSAMSVANGANHSCALMLDHTVQCWGKNDYGQIGHGSNPLVPNPVTVSGITSAAAIDLGSNFSCALLLDKTVQCWGASEYSQRYSWLHYSATPEMVTGLSSVIAISAGDTHTCALLVDQTVKCWGSNGSGQIGDGSYIDRPTPVTVSGINSAIAIEVGGLSSCALLTDLTVKCWGNNYWGQLGDGTGIDKTTPVAVSGITSAESLSTGQGHSCAVLLNGQVKCWGLNSHGQLGDRTRINRLMPVSVWGLVLVDSISAGGSHSCAVLQSAEVKCWGSNQFSQLGISSTSDSCPVVAGPSLPYFDACIPVTVADKPSNFSPIASVTPSTTPSLPEALMVDVAPPKGLRVSWNEPADNGGQSITSYLVEYSSDSGSTWLPLTPISASDTSATLTDLSNGSSYMVRVAAVNPLGTSVWALSSDQLLPTPPDAPTGLSVAGFTGTSVSLTWNAPTSNGGAAITDYIIQYRIVGEGTWSTFSDGTSVSTNTTVTGLNRGSNYEFQVGAENIMGTTWDSTISQTTAYTYSLTYSYNLATGGNSVPTAIFTTGGTAITLPTPTRTGYTFSGWYSDAGLSSKIGDAGASYSPTGTSLALNAYAKWTANTYSVTYNYNSATGGDRPVIDSFTTGGTAITLPTPTRTGYTFAGWYFDAGLIYKIGDAGENYSPPGSPLTLSAYAEWTRNIVKATSTVKPTFTGSAKVSKTLTAQKGTWIGYPTPTVSYQWYACSSAISAPRSAVPTTCKVITGANKSTLKIASAQKGKFVSVGVTGSSDGTTKTIWLTKSTGKVT
jgi:uncharacterized repeat protein (TIGR02543 family)